MFSYEEPVFIISVAARMLGIRTQTLRYYESLGLIQPARTRGNQRVFSRRGIERVHRVRNLMEELGVNLAGIEVVLRLLDRLTESENEKKQLQSEIKKLRTLLNNYT